MPENKYKPIKYKKPVQPVVYQPKDTKPIWKPIWSGGSQSKSKPSGYSFTTDTPNPQRKTVLGRLEDKGWTFFLNGKNITDEHKKPSKLATGQADPVPVELALMPAARGLGWAGNFVADMITGAPGLRELGAGLGKGVLSSIDNLSEKYLPNAYKYNPWAGKGDIGYTDLWRIQNKNDIPLSQLAKENKLTPSFLNTGEAVAKFAEREKHFGNWFTKDKSDLDWYARDREFTNPEILNVKIPNNELDKYSVSNIPSANKLSLASDKEFILSPQDRELYKPHWLKGYKKVPKDNFRPEINLSNAQQQGGFFFDKKGILQQYPKGNLTNEEIIALRESPEYKRITEVVNEFKSKYNVDYPHYYETMIKNNNRSGVNNVLYGGDNYNAGRYLGTAMGAYVGIVGPIATGLMGLSTFGNRNQILNVHKKLGLYDPRSIGFLTDKDTTIDLTNRNMDYAKVNESKDGEVILGGEFIEDRNNSVRTAKNWMSATDNYSDKEYPSKDIKSFYGIENGKFKVGKASDFNPETEIVPIRFGDTNINKAVLNGAEMRLLDGENNPIYQNTPNRGKFILYSPSTKKSEFVYINTGKDGVDKVNDFLQKNKDAQYIHLDNGRYEYYGVNHNGLSKQDFNNYYEQDLIRKGNPGYNLILKHKNGGIVEYGEGSEVKPIWKPIWSDGSQSKPKSNGYSFTTDTPNPQRGISFWSRKSVQMPESKKSNEFKSYQSDPEYFNGHANYTTNSKYNDIIREHIYAGTHEFNPTTGELRKLNSPVNVPSDVKEQSTRRYTEVSRAKQHDLTYWNDDQIKQLIQYENEKAYQNPLMYAPGMIYSGTIAPALGTIAGIMSAGVNTTQGNYNKAALDIGLTMLPFAVNRLIRPKTINYPIAADMITGAPGIKEFSNNIVKSILSNKDFEGFTANRIWKNIDINGEQKLIPYNTKTGNSVQDEFISDQIGRAHV